MATYEEERAALAQLCKKCCGLCCRNGSNITLSQREFNALQKYQFEKGVLTSPHGNMNTIQTPPDGWCDFIEESDSIGCILSGDMKPLSCRLFPLTFVVEDDNVVFYLSEFCPYSEEVKKLKIWIEETITTAKKELETWTLSEKLCRTYWHKRHGHLIPLDEY
jgi:Fe-S-cluster containining protein